ncbi:hypothetical protein [Streptomyces sp. NPDC048845]|uniref:hypothetical protein n=1 Tax=Streptomyces sp. NPDC048845 TaxID=3155390 RepID=UPI00344625B2
MNLGTYAKFDAPLDQVWVTASIDYMGYSVAATTVATPESLTVNAGTEYAEPSSCTYDLAKSGDGYKVDSKGSDCNITYRRSSRNDSYELTAELTWRVHWTASADPGGPLQQPALPDGTSSTTEDVVVKEVQSINR